MSAAVYDLGAWLSLPGATTLELLMRLLLAVALGGLIGYERERSDKPAGFRTNILICLGAALFTEMSVLLAAIDAVPAGAGDPTRIAAQIVSGMGFLGAGTIIQARGSVRGLTTAATLWSVAAIGMAAGGGAYALAIGATFIVIVILAVFGRIERLVMNKSFERLVQITFEPRPELLEIVHEIMDDSGLRIEMVDIEKKPTAFTIALQTSGPRARWEAALRRLLEAPGITKVTPL